MERWWFNLLILKKELERKCGIKKSTDTIENEDVDNLFGIRNFTLDNTFLVRDSNGDSYFMDFDLKNPSLEIDNDRPFMGELENSSYMNNRSPSQEDFDTHYMYDTESSWHNYNTCIENSLQPQISIDTSIGSDISNNYISSLFSNIFSDTYTYNSSDLTLSESSNDLDTTNLDTTYPFPYPTEDPFTTYPYPYPTEDPFTTYPYTTDPNTTEDPFTTYPYTTDPNTTDPDTTDPDTTDPDTTDPYTTDPDTRDPDTMRKYWHLWVQCENCYGFNYKKFFKYKMNICEECGYHLKMSSSDRIETSIDPGTWDPMDEDMVTQDLIGFFSEEDGDLNYIDSYQRKTGLADAVQTGVGQLNGIPVAIAVMDFQICGGSMGYVVGEKITRLVEYATNKFLPLIIVCASGGARMHEGSLSLMQMAKISSSLLDYQSSKKFLYVPILASPTTGGVTASFGMLGDIIIAEPNATIAFAGKRVIEETLNTIVPEGVQETENLFDKGLFDLIVPRNHLKSVLDELLKLHAFFPLNSN
nr:acetyl-CoA carboxylase subunit beta [Utricularia graminifolia]